MKTYPVIFFIFMTLYLCYPRTISCLQNGGFIISFLEVEKVSPGYGKLGDFYKLMALIRLF